MKGWGGAKPKNIDLPILMPINHACLRVQVSKVKVVGKLYPPPPPVLNVY